MAVIFGVSSLSNPLPPLTTRVSDKILHLVEYSILAVLFVRALASEGLGWRAAILVAIVLTSLYGVSDEYHQAFVPGRLSDVRDWITDTVGAGIGAFAYAYLSRHAGDGG